MLHDLWSMVYGLWSMVYGLWFMHRHGELGPYQKVAVV